MLVDPEDGACRSCGGQLEITDFDDCSMTVLCTNADCGDSYDVETDAFGDGCVTYYFNLKLKKLTEATDE
jgi:hypothetical protein